MSTDTKDKQSRAQGLGIQTKPDPIRQGRINPHENTKGAAEKHHKYLFPLLGENGISIERVTGEEVYLIPRKLSDYKGWNNAARRFTGGPGGTGLLYRVYDTIHYNKSAILIQPWIPPVEEQRKNSYPRVNPPSNINTEEEMYDLLYNLDVYQLTLYARPDETIPRYSFCKYSEIPIEYWYGWNKHGRNKINSIKFPKYRFQQYQVGEGGKNLASHIRQELKK